MPEVLPRIAWDNRLPAATLEASSSAPGHDVSFVCDDTLYRSWMPTAAGSHWITITWSSPQLLNCWCMFGYSQVTSIQAQVFVNSAWQAFGQEVNPAGECQYLTASAVLTDRARFLLTCVEPCRVAALFLGSDLVLESGLRPGWVDPVLGTRKHLVHATSRTGLPLPSIVEDEYAEQRISLADVDWSWAKAQWLPFKNACQTRPFFLRWHDDEPACYCSNATFEEEQFSKPGFVNVGVSARMDVQ